MKISNEVLVELISIFSDGLIGKKDASIALRELDLVPGKNDLLALSEEYLKSHPRMGDWEDENEEEEELN